MNPSSKTPLERTADVLDVHVIDVLAQLEALLRSVHEIQRAVLRVRGTLPPGAGDGDAVEDIQLRLARMAEECEALRSAIDEATPVAAELKQIAHAEDRPAER